MRQPSNLWALIRCFFIPEASYAAPSLPISRLVVLNGHTISYKIAYRIDFISPSVLLG